MGPVLQAPGRWPLTGSLEELARWTDSWVHGPTLPITQKPSEAPAAFLLLASLLLARPAPPGIATGKQWRPTGSVDRQAVVTDKQW